MGLKARDGGAEPAQDQAPSEDTENTASLSQRIGASASGLLRSSFERPSPGTVAESLASLNSDTSKGAASSSASNSEASSSSQARSIQGSSTAPSLPPVKESFRAGRAAGIADSSGAQAAYDEFAAGRRVIECDTYQALNDMAWHEGRSLRTQEQDNGRFSEASELIGKANGQYVDHSASSLDGAAVVALLSNPAFNIDEEPTNSWAVGTFHKGKAPLGSPPVEQQPDNPTNSIAPVNPLDLMPDFSTSWDPILHSVRYQVTNFSDPAFGDVQPWLDMLNRYHDEVWGDMLPLVREAREEIKTASSSKEGALRDRPALRRLGMLLKHLP